MENGVKALLVAAAAAAAAAAPSSFLLCTCVYFFLLGFQYTHSLTPPLGPPLRLICSGLMALTTSRKKSVVGIGVCSLDWNLPEPALVILHICTRGR